MAKKQNPEPINTGTTKFEQVVDHGEIIQIWKFDKRINKTPYEIENIYKGDSRFSKLKKGSI
jgi:hypothetical protein